VRGVHAFLGLDEALHAIDSSPSPDAHG